MNNSVHAFSVSLARDLGLEQALLLQHFNYWTQCNASNPEMSKDGRVWVFCSRANIKKVFPYLSEQKIRTSIEKLIEGGYLVKGEYSALLTNKSNWYALTDFGKSLFDDDTEPLVKTTNGLVKTTNDINSNKNNTLSIEEKRRILREKCEPFVGQYGREMVEAFILYWGEANGNRIRCEIAKQKSGAFEVSRRLATWAGKEYNRPVSRPAVTPPAKPQKPIWEALGLTREQYAEIQKTSKI